MTDLKVLTNTELVKVLTRYEGAVSRCERDGDDSDDALTEMESSREALLEILRQVRDALP